MEKLIEIDIYLFKFINQGLANQVTDFIMPIVTNGRYWLPVYFLMFFYLIFIYQRVNSENKNLKNYFYSFNTNKKGLIIALLLAIGVVLSDQISATFIKEWVGRLRPCKTMDVHLLVNCGAGKSFPSSHAANNFLAATILSNYFKKWVYLFFFLASLIALSRVFVGVHYPVDITVGAFLGWIIGYLIVKLSKLIFQKSLD